MDTKTLLNISRLAEDSGFSVGDGSVEAARLFAKLRRFYEGAFYLFKEEQMMQDVKEQLKENDNER